MLVFVKRWLFASLITFFVLTAAPLRAEEGSSGEPSGMYIKPAYGLDIRPDTQRRETPSQESFRPPNRQLQLSDNVDACFIKEKPRMDMPDKKLFDERRALFGIMFHF